MAQKVLIGKITHYFPNVKAAVVVIEKGKKLKIGDKILVEGHGNSFEQTVSSMQIDRKPIKEAAAGQAVGLEIAEDVKAGDLVYKA